MWHFICWQAWTDIREEIAVAVKKGCHYVGLRKQHLGYHNSRDFWHCMFQLWFWLLHCVDVGSAN
jgi:hypothetical protein